MFVHECECPSLDCVTFGIACRCLCKVRVTGAVSELLSSHAKSKYSVPRRHYKLFAGQSLCSLALLQPSNRFDNLSCFLCGLNK